ncbi:MAG TPA: amidohydrolase family protein [Chitinophagaceae bacterium]|nr:amidohydrolase family protein [Chitinophagaceae bacterium]
MKRASSICLLLVFSFSVKSQEITLAITDCNVITMKSDKVLYHQTILISNEKILKIVPATQLTNKQNVKTIDGTGKYIIPGLADMHIHVNQYSNWVFTLLLSYGVTTIRVMSGNEAVLKWRDSVNNNLKIAPDIHSASQLIDGNPPYWGNLHDGLVVQNADSVEQIIVDQTSKGYEFIKVYNRLDPLIFKRIRSVCFEKNIKLTGHIPASLDKNDMLTEQTGEIEHLSGYARYASNIDTVSKDAISKNSDMGYDLELANNISADKMRSAARKTKEYNIWNCPTLIVHGIKSDTMFCKELPDTELGQKLTRVLGWWKSQGYNLSPDEKKLWDFKKAMIRELDLNKTFLLAGSDSPAPWVVPGLSLHQELMYMAAAGLSNYDALKTATVNPAIWFGKDYDGGTIESGKRADLLILSANPLKDIRNTQKIVSVIFKGKVVGQQR